jgi:sigma-B regulation protein RsbU (phosphoserine phosphatase)
MGFSLEWCKGCDYPVVTMTINSGERFLVYTDGVVDVENSRGDFFGDIKLEEVVRDNESRPAAELSTELLSERDYWRLASVPQQDDIPLVVIDVV